MAGPINVARCLTFGSLAELRAPVGRRRWSR